MFKKKDGAFSWIYQYATIEDWIPPQIKDWGGNDTNTSFDSERFEKKITNIFKKWSTFSTSLYICREIGNLKIGKKIFYCYLIQYEYWREKTEKEIVFLLNYQGRLQE